MSMPPRPTDRLVLLGNGLAWIALVGLAIVAVLVVLRIGAPGLLLLGLLTLFVCSQFSLHDDMPSWGTEVFKATMEKPGSLEQRAARAAEHRERLAPLRFYRRCGVAMTVLGAAASVWGLTR